MNVVEGGISAPMVEEQASVPTASVSSYLLFRISGRAMALMAMEPESTSPTTAPKAAQAHTLPWARPPRKCPSQRRAQVYRSLPKSP